MKIPKTLPSLQTIRDRLQAAAAPKQKIPDEQTRVLVAVLVALEGAAVAVKKTIAEMSDLRVASAALKVVAAPENNAAIQAMTMAAIAAATSALGAAEDAAPPAPPPEPAIPDGWPPGWGYGFTTSEAGDKFFAMRGDQPTALRWDSLEEARRDAWVRHQSETPSPG